MTDIVEVGEAKEVFTPILLEWYAANKRVLPWRENHDPYSIWLSEIILQQTRIDQGMAYYHKFMDAFPEVRFLAAASEDQVLRHWQGLGYYSRARNLHSAAKMVMNEFGGLFPQEYEQILKLPGVGPYTAAAIASMAFGKQHAVVDGNVFRLLSRWFGIATPIDSTSGKKEFSALANALIPASRPGDFNQAMMDFGSLVCRPVSPLCGGCPLAAGCTALRKNKVGVYPAKAGKTKVKSRYLLYLLPQDKNGNTLIRRRNSNDIWQGLYEFPLIEFDVAESRDNFLNHPNFIAKLNDWQGTVQEISGEKQHLLSHRRLHLVFVHIKASRLKADREFIILPEADLQKYAMP
ncbi:MAG: A/G-specific adenine glycosylase, partial [Bacteroidetes bacterium]|nr:A/G-specific adenine glycosylase [Bacteroidota bacterium]